MVSRWGMCPGIPRADYNLNRVPAGGRRGLLLCARFCPLLLLRVRAGRLRRTFRRMGVCRCWLPGSLATSLGSAVDKLLRRKFLAT